MSKKFILFTIFVLFTFAGCGDPDSIGQDVLLDGPILESVEEGKLEFNGALINDSDIPVKSVYVVIVLRDDMGNIIEANSSIVVSEEGDEILYPSERSFFSITFNAEPSSVFSKDVEIYYEEEEL